jgi:hypothetical protein
MKGLLFSEPMVKAWMDGRKTLTRRLIKVSSEMELGYTHCMGPTILDVHFYGAADDCIVKPRYFPGETVYIKETWAQHPTAIECGYPTIFYKQRGDTLLPDNKWKSPRFMPEWASRIHALIVSVRPERVQEITGEDATREGCIKRFVHPCGPGQPSVAAQEVWSYGKSEASDPVSAFEMLWESLHPGSWERNDWVWRIELERKP